MDEAYSAKITDFGFGLPTVRQIGSTSTVTVSGSSALVRLRGYLAPEFKDGIVGVGIDVFSYGIVRCLVEILCEHVKTIIRTHTGCP